MSKKIGKLIIATIVGLILFVLIKDLFKSNDKNLTVTQRNDLSQYLTSPWVTERIGWFFFRLPEKWTENTKEISKSNSKYAEICNEARMFELKLNDFFFACMYMDVKNGIYENWDLNKSAEATISQVLYNIGCKDIKLEKMEPFDNLLEVNYQAKSICSPSKYKAMIKGVRYENYILLSSVYYRETNSNHEIIATKIIENIENKYPDLSKVKN